MGLLNRRDRSISRRGTVAIDIKCIGTHSGIDPRGMRRITNRELIMEHHDLSFRKWDFFVNVLLMAVVLFTLVRMAWAI